MFAAVQAWLGTIVTTVSDLGRRLAAAHVDVAVLLVERVDLGIRVLDEQAVAGRAQSRVRRECLRPRVDDRPLARRPADDGRDDAQRAVLERHRAVDEQGAVAVDVGADAELVDDTELVCALGRRRAAAADPVDREPRASTASRAALSHAAVSGSDG